MKQLPSLKSSIAAQKSKMEIAKHNAHKDLTEIKIVSVGVTLAILTYICLRKLTQDTTKHRNERLKKQKMNRARQIQAEKDEVIKKYESLFSSIEFDWTALMKRSSRIEDDFNTPISFTRQKRISTSSYKSCNNSQPSGQSRFNFEPHYIASFLKSQQTENATPNTPFSPGENYKDWSLRRRDVQIMLMD